MKVDSASHTALSAVLISFFTLGSVAGDDQVRFPSIINWWDRKWVTKKPRTEPFLSAAYYYPYMCSIVFYNPDRLKSGLLVGEWASVCTILTQHWVAFSIDNVDRPSDSHNARFNTIRYHHSIYRKELKVVHGTVYGSPATDVQNPLIKNHTIDMLFYHSNLDLAAPTTFTVKNDADYSNWNISQLFKRNPLGGAETGVAFARIEGAGFVWDAFTLQAPIVAASVADVVKKVEDHIKFLEELPSSQKSCYVGAYHRFNKKMKWFQVMYIPHNECKEVYCTFDSRACLEFPNKEHHVCFKSLIYGDLCPEDRGTAVYCPDFDHSIFGILSTAPNCGWKNLPNVYTRIDITLKMFSSSQNPGPKESWRTFKYPDDLKKYTLMPPGLVRGP